MIIEKLSFFSFYINFKYLIIYKIIKDKKSKIKSKNMKQDINKYSKIPIWKSKNNHV